MSEPYIAGAYLLVKPGPPLGAHGLTASACIADIAPDCWAIDWVTVETGEREMRAKRLGIRLEDISAMVRWVTEEFDHRFRWPNVFTDLGIARDFHDRFRPSPIRLLGIALPADLVESFLSVAAPPEQQPGFAPVGPTGVYDMLRSAKVLEPGGASRGFDVLGYDEAGQFCSFRCNGLEVDFESKLGARFNQWGLLEDETMARRCAEYANRPEVPTCSRTWHPWLMEEYTLENKVWIAEDFDAPLPADVQKLFE